MKYNSERPVRLTPPTSSAFADLGRRDVPQLIVVIDAEEEFDWTSPFTRLATGVEGMRQQERALRVFQHYGVVPTYAVDYPVASQPRGYGPLREFAADGLCIIGAHLHPWVNPPFVERVSEYNSYPGNLPKWLQREKLLRLRDCIEKNFNETPKIYRAGRYGLGPDTGDVLSELGFNIDCSILPYVNMLPSCGPDFRAFTERPYWFGPDHELLEIPTTVGLVGLLAESSPILYNKATARFGSKLRMPGMLARLGLIERVQLTPEGTSLEEAKRLTTSLLRRGCYLFVLTYHSTSLFPGGNPYTRSAADVTRLIEWLTAYLDFFFVELRGSSSTPVRARSHAYAARQKPATSWLPCPGTKDPAKDLCVTDPAKCLLVASTFPPLVGGTCVVYHNLCKYGSHRILPLVPLKDFRDGLEIRGVNEYDRAAGYKVYRCSLLRPRQRRPAPWPVRLGRLAADAVLMMTLLLTVARIVRQERIEVVCIGELTYCGWLVIPCKYLLGLALIIYVHGEEITTSGTSLAERVKFRWLGLADRIIAVSNFTAKRLVDIAGVDQTKITVIPNGVDTKIFHPVSVRAELMSRYGLTGKRVLLSVGRLVERKGIDQVIRALPKILLHEPNVRYLVVGEGEYQRVLCNLAAEVGVSRQVVFAGKVSEDELVDHYALSEVFVQPNRDLEDGDTEGFGLVFLEANACGRPVVAGNAGGAPDAVSNGVNGLVVDGRDTAQISEAILRLLCDRQLYKQLRIGGLARAKESAWAERVIHFRKVCESLRGVHRRRRRRSKQLV